MRPLLWAALVGALAPSAAALDDLQTLIDQTPAGQTLTLPPGTYQGPAVILRPLVLRAEPGALLVRPSGAQGPTLRIASSKVTVEGLTIEGTGVGGREDRTTLVASGSDVALVRLEIRGCWSGVWIDRSEGVRVEDLTVLGLTRRPFWERGEGIRITGSRRVQVRHVRLRSVGDGLYAEGSRDLDLWDVTVRSARYGLHLMASEGGTAREVSTSATVVGAMVMESGGWTITSSRFGEGYATGSAGIREVRTHRVAFVDNAVARQTVGVDLVDVRDGRFEGNTLAENAAAWTWGGDNAGTQARGNRIRGNLQDLAAGTPAVLGPTFEGNSWDAWRGTDLDRDGVGDTPYRVEADAGGRGSPLPWAGIFLGSPWTLWSQTIPGGRILDPHPLPLTSN